MNEQDNMVAGSMLAACAIFPLLLAVSLCWIRRSYRQGLNQQLAAYERRRYSNGYEYLNSIDYWRENIAGISMDINKALIATIVLSSAAAFCFWKVYN